MRPFTAHPTSVGQTYLSHAKYALGLGFTLILAGLAAIIHAIFPCLFTHTASATIKLLYQSLRSK
jgi:hypothetical protein